MEITNENKEESSKMSNLDAILTFGAGLGISAIIPLFKLVLNLDSLLDKKLGSINYSPEWYQKEYARLDDLFHSTFQAALQKDWQILYTHLRQYRYN